MLPELIFREERLQNTPLLVLLGIATSMLGFTGANILFPSEVGLVTVVLAAIPLVYPLTRYFLEDEENNRPHLPEIFTYGDLFLGQVIGFFLVAYYNPEVLSLQISMFESQLTSMGITGYATAPEIFRKILANNVMVFFFILGTATVIGSAGAFILTWNASVLGVFLAILTRELSESYQKIVTGTELIPTPLAYVPHATFEMTGFIVAGVSGSLLSASLYRAIESFLDKTEISDLTSPKAVLDDIISLIKEIIRRVHWVDYSIMIFGGLLMILVGAVLETA
jgi:uncharacterized membrane protein SpoIIM required for sporulation